VGSELRISKNCELRVSSPTLEVMSDDHGQALDSEHAFDAVLDYRFDPETAEHVIRLLSPAKSWGCPKSDVQSALPSQECARPAVARLGSDWTPAV